MKFEQLIIKCCKLPEWELRDFLKSELSKAGFSIKEDDYRSSRGGKYLSVKNMLAIRGDAKVCLVAHTDVCRDHGMRRTAAGYEVNPVIKTLDKGNEQIKIIQDETCSVQTGGDDRLGVAINLWTALHSQEPMALLFCTDEEIGCESSDVVDFPELMSFDLLCQVDRGNHSRQLVVDIYGCEICDEDMASRLLQLSEDIGLPRYPVSGLLTDVYAIRRRGKARCAVNMTCGYHHSYGASAEEYIDIEEARDTQVYVDAIITLINSQGAVN